MVPADDCVFCRMPELGDEDAFILERRQHAYSVLNLYPYTTGHLIVVPYRHTSDMEDLRPEESADLWALLTSGVAACRSALEPQGFNLGANLGRVAGAGIPDHIHFHVVPRWAGDTNFMSTVGHTRVLPEDLPTTWQAMRAALGPMGD
jgi:ATP adenylyltransferase